jgi:hypothetical protein
MSSESLVVMAKPPTRLPDLPAEIMMEIFREVTVSADNSQDLISLATSSKHFYAFFKQNELAILRRAVTHLLATALWPKREDPVLANYVIKIAVLRLTKPWPVGIDAIKTAIARAQDAASAPLAVDPSMHGRIMAWARSEVRGQPTPHYRQNKYLGLFYGPQAWVLRRGAFVLNNHLTVRTVPGLPIVWHPFEWIDPEEILHVVTKDGHRFHSYHLKKALAQYEEHANYHVSVEEEALFGTPGYVACCMCDECPRFVIVAD